MKPVEPPNDWNSLATPTAKRAVLSSAMICYALQHRPSWSNRVATIAGVDREGRAPGKLRLARDLKDSVRGTADQRKRRLFEWADRALGEGVSTARLGERYEAEEAVAASKREGPRML